MKAIHCQRPYNYLRKIVGDEMENEPGVHLYNFPNLTCPWYIVDGSEFSSWLPKPAFYYVRITEKQDQTIRNMGKKDQNQWGV